MTVRITVPLGALEVRAAPAELEALGLGSCVGVTLWDARARVGGLAHILLPAPPPGRAAQGEARYASTAIPLLIAGVASLGGDPSRLEATIAGGGAMFAGLHPPGSVQTGERNVVAAREALRVAGVPVRGEWCGGEHGRSIRFDVATGTVTVSSVRHGSRQL